MNYSKTTTIVDIPPNIADELERLHKLMDESPLKDQRDWAMEKIDKIHRIFFESSFTIGAGEQP